MINIAICDDEKNFLLVLKNAVEEEFLKNSLNCHIDVFENGEQLIHAKGFKEYDLIFLDIDMPNMSGIDIVENYLRNSDQYIIFVTNRDDLVFEALKCQPMNFIRKQHLVDELPAVILSTAKRYYANQKYYDFNVNRVLKRVKLCDILYIESRQHYVTVVCNKNSDSFVTKLSIKKLESELRSSFFIRIHMGYLVNAQYIKQIGNETVILDNEVQLPLSRYRVEDTKKAFQRSRRSL